jgi:hypothetical protein
MYNINVQEEFEAVPNKKTAPVKKTGAVELYLLTHRK